MEVTMEIEDDVFFADLSKRIALLITDDEDDLAVHCPSVSLQAFSQVCHPIQPLPLLHDQNCRRESKGTGVFIPRSSLPRRKNKQGIRRSSTSHNSSGTTKSSYRSQNEKSRLVSSQVSSDNQRYGD